jgi:two-component system, NarL family, response regulator YdfI
MNLKKKLFMVYKIAIIEDDENYAESLQLFLQQDGLFRIAKRCHSVEQFESVFFETEMDAVLLDINLKGINGLDGLASIRNIIPAGCPVIILTNNNRNDYIKKAIATGANGYLLKTELLSEIYWQLISMLQHNAIAISRQVFNSLQSFISFTKDHDPLFDKLTQREKDITKQVLLGYDYRTIANNLFISQGTVNSHLKSIYIKMDVNSKTELMALLLPHNQHV